MFPSTPPGRHCDEEMTVLVYLGINVTIVSQMNTLLSGGRQVLLIRCVGY
ncbi:MAG: hypothetical protein CM1200mP26_05240 [Acidimicrobiales bacterium]|nr:MAG: hypothetical protein CM1200mP26_05240 [Acidimicrobiales bacterium]